MKITLEEAKLYLKVDSCDEDAFIIYLIVTAQSLIEDIIRVKLDDVKENDSVIKTAVFYIIAYLYENRGKADYKDMVNTIKNLLFALRKEVF